MEIRNEKNEKENRITEMTKNRNINKKKEDWIIAMTPVKTDNDKSKK